MFGREAVVRFAVGRPGPVELAVFDVLGRRVRTLEKSELEAREYRRFWDGRDDAGVRVGSGVYFYRLKADGFQQVRKITWVR
jgi:flagellar hook assembly protein FlgD